MQNASPGFLFPRPPPVRPQGLPAVGWLAFLSCHADNGSNTTNGRCHEALVSDLFLVNVVGFLLGDNSG